MGPQGSLFNFVITHQTKLAVFVNKETFMKLLPEHTLLEISTEISEPYKHIAFPAALLFTNNCQVAHQY
jgi:hypothetical protein